MLSSHMLCFDCKHGKVDRPSARLSGEVENELFDLFVQLGAEDEQMDYPTLYASGKLGYVCLI